MIFPQGAHNPKVRGSNPLPATKNPHGKPLCGFSLVIFPSQFCCSRDFFARWEEVQQKCINSGRFSVRFGLLQFCCSPVFCGKNFPYCGVSLLGSSVPGRKPLIRSMAFRFSSSSTWEYFSVVTIEAWPMRFWMMRMGTFCSISLVAKVCPYGIIRTNRKTHYYQGCSGVVKRAYDTKYRNK